MSEVDEYATDFEVVEDANIPDAMREVAAPRLVTTPAPVHPLSSLVTIAVDLVWLPLEAAATMGALVALLPLMLTCAATCFVSVMLIQRYVARDTWRTAIAKAGAMGVVAGVPYAVVGTIAGGVLLGWAGIHELEPIVRRSLPTASK